MAVPLAEEELELVEEEDEIDVPVSSLEDDELEEVIEEDDVTVLEEETEEVEDVLLFEESV